MADTTTPITPPTNDLQINLADAPKTEPTITEPANIQAEPNLDLDINLPETPKNDDRLKDEDQKNAEIQTAPIAEIPTEVQQESPLQQIPEMKTTEPTPTVIEPTPKTENKEQLIEEKQPEVHEEEIKPSSRIEEIPTEKKDDLPQESSLKTDSAIINELEGHPNAGGLAPEAKLEATPIPAETPKTFDLDAMLGDTTPPSPTEISSDRRKNEEDVVGTAPTAPISIEQKTEQSEIPSMTATITPEPITPPAFTIPTPTSTVPVQAVTQTTLPQNKTKGVKVLLFVVLFAALGFTTYFILKTMYPIEFNNMFGGENQMHASEEITGTTEEITRSELTGEELTGTELTGMTEEKITEDIMTGTNMSGTDNGFGELNDLGITTKDTTTMTESDVSKLTDYTTKGNELLEQGKVIGNNTVIKYGLYISKKSTDLLQKIANGEQIDNLSGYFAQFDKYINQLETILKPTVETPTAGIPAITDETSSPTTNSSNDISDMTNTAPSAESHASSPIE